jgi:two-component system OmpR family response regulator
MSSNKLVAVVEDEIAIRDNYLAGLRRHGYRVSGYGSRGSAAAFRRLDLVIIDVNLGGEVGGLRAVSFARARPSCRLSLRPGRSRRRVGLPGADDYYETHQHRALARRISCSGASKLRAGDAPGERSGDTLTLIAA